MGIFEKAEVLRNDICPIKALSRTLHFPVKMKTQSSLWPFREPVRGRYTNNPDVCDLGMLHQRRFKLRGRHYKCTFRDQNNLHQPKERPSFIHTLNSVELDQLFLPINNTNETLLVHRRDVARPEPLAVLGERLASALRIV